MSKRKAKAKVVEEPVNQTIPPEPELVSTARVVDDLETQLQIVNVTVDRLRKELSREQERQHILQHDLRHMQGRLKLLVNEFIV